MLAQQGSNVNLPLASSTFPYSAVVKELRELLHWAVDEKNSIRLSSLFPQPRFIVPSSSSSS